MHWPDSINNFVGVVKIARAYTQKKNGWGSGVGGGYRGREGETDRGRRERGDRHTDGQRFDRPFSPLRILHDYLVSVFAKKQW